MRSRVRLLRHDRALPFRAHVRALRLAHRQDIGGTVDEGFELERDERGRKRYAQREQALAKCAYDMADLLIKRTAIGWPMRAALGDLQIARSPTTASGSRWSWRARVEYDSAERHILETAVGTYVFMEPEVDFANVDNLIELIYRIQREFAEQQKPLPRIVANAAQVSAFFGAPTGAWRLDGARAGAAESAAESVRLMATSDCRTEIANLFIAQASPLMERAA